MKHNYKLIRSKRRTVSITVNEHNEIIVRAPMHTSLSYIDDFVKEKSDWIEKHLTKNAAINRANKDVIAYKKIYVCGNILPFFIGDSDEIDKNFVSVKKLSHLKKLYVDTLGSDFLALFYSICDVTSLKCASVNFKDYKSRWGCCDGKNNIIFNYKLLMLPNHLQAYVILHELCHTLQHNHSKKFWQAVEKFMPDYKSKRMQMKAFTFVARAY